MKAKIIDLHFYAGLINDQSRKLPNLNRDSIVTEFTQATVCTLWP